jgi:hypothetical protein
MSDSWLKRIAWLIAVYVVIVLIVSSIRLFSAAYYSSISWVEIQVRTITGIGAPILGLIIVLRQPQHRVGWLLLILGFSYSFRSLGYAIFYGNELQATGYSAFEYFLLWATEAANIIGLAGQTLLLLWFPDGKLPSHRWRFLYLTLLLAFLGLFLILFNSDPNWNGGAGSGGVVIANPYGWLPADLLPTIAPFAFFTLVLSMLLAAVSLFSRYRSARNVVRYQIRWFVLGGLLFAIMNFAPLGTISNGDVIPAGKLWLYVIVFSNAIPLYLAVGLAILRYRLYDIDIIIRKTIQYAILTGLFALVYFGSVILLQSLVEKFTGDQSPLVVVFSTLVIAALFNPLRNRIQDFIDRRFYRKRYDAEKALAQFSATTRDSVDIDQLNTALMQIVEETMQPEQTSLWLLLDEKVETA